MKKAITVFYLLFICLVGSACATSLVVNSSGDEPDNNLNDGKCETSLNECTLRAAIMEANVLDDVSLITFENVGVIKPTSALPPLTASNTHINGEGVVTLNGNLYVEIGGSGLEVLGSSRNVIQGLTIKYFWYGISILDDNGTAKYNVVGPLASDLGDSTKRNILIYNQTGLKISGQGTSDNTVTGNYIGTYSSGLFAKPNDFAGILIINSAHDNLIGSISGSGVLQGGNLISGNGGVGIFLGEGTSHNHLTGNYIGTTKNGNGALANGEGLRIVNSSNNYIGIGPSGDGKPNLISGNTYDGLFLENAYHNTIAGNYIGTNQSGTSALPNRYGAYLTSGSSSNVIGTNGDGTADTFEGNLISGNLYGGVRITSTNSIHNVIAGNYIGTNFDATAPIGNGGAGVTVSGDLNLIGTNGDGVADSLEANVISGNDTVGIQLNAFSSHVSGNFIGTDNTGMYAIGNAFDGIMINTMSSGNLIGTNGDGIADVAERNIISGNAVGLNGSAGIAINGDNNIVAGNYIGTDATGNTALGNLQDGISLGDSASGNLIGTEGDGVADDIEGNLISGNGRNGIWLLGTASTKISGNLIGTNQSGSTAIPNGHAYNEALGGIYISHGANNNVIGTDSDGSNDTAEGNLISGNAHRGIVIRGATTENNIVAGNKIGTDISGGAPLGNGVGIEINTGASYNRIGTDGNGNSDIAEQNLVSGNTGPGIFVSGFHNIIAGNYIGTDISGTTNLGNGTNGITIANDTSENHIGGSVQKANIIAFNGGAGIYVTGLDADKVLILHNSIHSNDKNGIKLSSNAVLPYNPNDPGDIDLGPNDLMNFPILDSASVVPPMLAITGQIVDGLPNTSFLIQFFVNDVCDSPANHGEGKTYSGSTNQITDGSGNVSFLVSFASGVTGGQFITATATTDNKTSEFSGCVEVVDAQTYSLELEEDRCSYFGQDEITLITSYVDPKLLVLNMYAKMALGVPGLEIEKPDDTDEWVYTAFIGGIESTKCNFQGYAGRLYCDFIIPKDYINTSQELKIFVNLCTPPIYVNEKVSIFTKCSSDMNESECVAAGGVYSCTAACTCICP